MENIIEHLFKVHMETDSHPLGKIDKEKNRTEYTLYQCLIDELGAEHKEKFRKYVNVCIEQKDEELKAMYEYGFKAAVRMFLEAIKD